MSSNIKFEYVSESENMFYDIDAICRNAAIFWTLVPYEVADHIYNYTAYTSVDYKWE